MRRRARKSWRKNADAGKALDGHMPDAFLAAEAVTRGLAVVTRNTSKFRNAGVETVNPYDIDDLGVAQEFAPPEVARGIERNYNMLCFTASVTDAR